MSSSLWILIIELIHYILHILRTIIPVVVIFFIFIITFLIITFIFFLWYRHLIIFIIRIIIFIFGKLVTICIVTFGISKGQTIFPPIINRSSSSTRSTRNFIISFKSFNFLISIFTRTIFRKVRKVIFESFTINFFSFWWVTCSLSLFLGTWTTVIWAATTWSSIRLFRSFIRYSLRSWVPLWLFSWFFCIISLTTSS